MMENISVQMENNVFRYAFIYYGIVPLLYILNFLKDFQEAFLNLSEGLAKFKIHTWLTKIKGTVYYLFILPPGYEKNISVVLMQSCKWKYDNDYHKAEANGRMEK